MPAPRTHKSRRGVRKIEKQSSSAMGPSVAGADKVTLKNQRAVPRGKRGMHGRRRMVSHLRSAAIWTGGRA